MTQDSYVEAFVRVRGQIDIDIHPHTAKRLDERPEATVRRVEAAVRHGRIDPEKCSSCPGKGYSKIVASHYDGKALITVEVVILHHEAFEIAEVRTVWVTQGRTSRKKSEK